MEKMKIPTLFKREAISMLLFFIGIIISGLVAAFVGPRLWRFLSH